MFDAAARKRGGAVACYESEDAFTDMVGRVLELGITEIGLYWPDPSRAAADVREDRDARSSRSSRRRTRRVAPESA